MKRDHVYSDALYRSRLVEHQVSRNVPPIVRLRGCNIEVRLAASVTPPPPNYKVVTIFKIMLNLSVETPVVVEGNPVFWLRNFLGKVSFFLVVEMVLELSGSASTSLEMEVM